MFLQYIFDACLLISYKHFKTVKKRLDYILKQELESFDAGAFVRIHGCSCQVQWVY